ncbi:MAG: hypothetical protein IJ023_07740 [Bacteroidales bacterium]|nr:hypothetical protein [Bacteroidales bacterium]MBQ8856018.1 hypothetical protein [Bacteroidales bacterium]
MKSSKDIENMSLEQLEAASMDENISVPDGFASRMEDGLEVLERLTEDESRKDGRVRMVRVLSAAAAAALLVGAGLGLSGRQDEPEDTFTDPYLAYAELEKAFAIMSGEIHKGLAMAEKSEEIIDRTSSVFSE